MSRSRTVGAVITVMIAAELVSAKVAPTSLEELTRVAESIVIGRVTEVISVEGTPIAKVSVIETLKGEPGQDLYYFARGTWICDVSRAEPGETSLLFLWKYDFGVKDDFGSWQQPPGFEQTVNELTGGAPLWRLAWAGRGRMPFRSINGTDFVTLWVGDVVLPRSIKTVAASEIPYSSLRSAPLADVVSIVRKSLRAEAEKLEAGSNN
jgi:hypothetical protein